MLIFTSHGPFPEFTADGLISLDQRITLLPLMQMQGLVSSHDPLMASKTITQKKVRQRRRKSESGPVALNWW